MKKYIISILSVLILCSTGPVFAEAREHGRGHEGYGNHGGGHGSYHDNHGRHHGRHHNHYYGRPHGPVYGFYGPVIVPVPAYYPPPRCRIVDVYDAWGNYMGQERICD